MFSSDNGECKQRLSGGQHELALKNYFSLIQNDKSRARQQKKEISRHITLIKVKKLKKAKEVGDRIIVKENISLYLKTNLGGHILTRADYLLLTANNRNVIF